MRTIDIYRGMYPPSQRFNPFFHSEYQKASKAVDDALDELKALGVPKSVINKVDSAYSNQTAVELELLWCFAFKEGITFERSINETVVACDISNRE